MYICTLSQHRWYKVQHSTKHIQIHTQKSCIARHGLSDSPDNSQKDTGMKTRLPIVIIVGTFPEY
jgi:hypothetical protein